MSREVLLGSSSFFWGFLQEEKLHGMQCSGERLRERVGEEGGGEKSNFPQLDLLICF